MPRRFLLATEQRTRSFAIPVDHVEMAKHYVLSVDDLALVRTKRRSINRLGFAIQLCLLQHPGQGLGPGEHPPSDNRLRAHQLGVSPDGSTLRSPAITSGTTAIQAPASGRYVMFVPRFHSKPLNGSFEQIVQRPQVRESGLDFPYAAAWRSMFHTR
jgi:hypothetical protein